MKKELLEYLVRSCAREVLSQKAIRESLEASFYLKSPISPALIDQLKNSNQGVEFHYNPNAPTSLRIRTVYSKNFDDAKADVKQLLNNNNIKWSVRYSLEEKADDIKGAAAPPMDGQGTADQPEVPNENPEVPESPEDKETPDTAPPPSSDLKGIVLVNPKDKSKLQKIPVKAGDDSSLERNLHKVAAAIAGPNVKIALSTLRLAKESSKNPNTTSYLYFGKYDPQSEEIFLMADKSLQIAKDSSVPPTEIQSTPVSYSGDDAFQPMNATANDFSQKIQQQGKTSAPQGLDEQKLRLAIKKMVKEIISKE